MREGQRTQDWCAICHTPITDYPAFGVNDILCEQCAKYFFFCKADGCRQKVTKQTAIKGFCLSCDAMRRATRKHAARS